MIRRILVDHARKYHAVKRGGKETRLSLDDAVSFPEDVEIDVLAVDEALLDLSRLDAQQGKVVELRFFGGLTMDETAEVMNISRSTVQREWNIAKAWLYNQLNKKSSRDS
jgi:RNA polymerase sigma factor (TIGR02999 family)